MTSQFEGKVVLITGGNSGIGLATARAFKAEGARIAITGRDPKTLKTAQEELGRDALVVQSDAASVADAERLVAAVRDRFGRLDVIFINAGVGKFVPFDQSSEELFDETFAINIRGAYFLVQKALPLLGPGSAIVLNATTAIAMGMPGSSIYTASKAALASLARTLAAELAERGIRVNVVNPGPITTPILGRMGLPKEALDQVKESIRVQVPLKRFGDADDIAAAVLYLAGAGYVTGTELFVDGGMSRV